MKAAVLHEVGGVPRYEDFPDPVAGDGEVLIEVRAVAVENVDRAIAAGRHFTSDRYLAKLPMIPCFDGVGVGPDGMLVGFGNPVPPYGALAERVVVPATNVVPVPAGLDPAESVVLGSAMTGMSIRTAAGFQAGETVLVQGATGVAGRLSVQVARLLGAGRIVATGRDDEALREVTALGADTVINTAVPDGALVEAFTATRGDGYDVVLDFLWGRPTELLLRSLVPDAFGFPRPTRLIQVGEAAGSTLALTADSVRTSGVEICGAAKGFDATTVPAAFQQVVEWVTGDELVLGVERVPLSGIESAWQARVPGGRRLVVLPNG